MSESEKMGFEREQRIVRRSYGKSGWFEDHGNRYWYASGAELDFLELICRIIIPSGEILEFEWQPGEFPLEYRHAGTKGCMFYRPDARIVWKEEGEFFYEIKHGRIEQSAGAKMVRFCRQYPEKKLVLVWKGREPRKGQTKRQWDKVSPWIDHVWKF